MQAVGDGPEHSSGEGLARRVREFRMLRRMSLRQMAERADVSPSFLSQLENGRSSASIATLARIAASLNVSVADLFDSGVIGPEPIRAKSRPVLRVEGGVKKTLLTHAPLEGVAVYAAQFSPNGSTGPEQYSHPGNHEVIITVSGRVVIQLNEARHVLEEGDSIEFDSGHPHRVVNEFDQPAEIHWIVGPAQPAFPKRRRSK